MNYIVLDLEWNQPKAEQQPIYEPIYFDSEIIEFGAVKLDENFKPIDEFRMFVKPVFYPVVNGHVSRLTKISRRDVADANEFPDVFNQFCDWCGTDYSLMTWGPTDIPVLMDNMIMHGYAVSPMPACFDLQRIFTLEVMREGGQCSLEKAVAALNISAERAHDALNDARNTAKICDFMDLDVYLKDYLLSYVDYTQVVLEQNVKSNEERSEIGSFICPYCGKKISPQNPWIFSNTVSARAVCPDGDDFLVTLSRLRLSSGKVAYKRIVIEMNDDIWDSYSEKSERLQKESKE